MAVDPIELAISREGESGALGFRTRMFLVNYPTYLALEMGIMSGAVQALGQPHTFGSDTLYVGGYGIFGTDAPDWSRVEVQYVREGELRYERIPSEIGYKTISGSTGTSELVIPFIKQKNLPGPQGAAEYDVSEVKTKRREVVLTIMANVRREDITEATLADFAAYQNRLVDIGVGADKWLFESISWAEASDRVTQVVGVFRGTDRRPEMLADELVFDVDIPELPPFSKYVVVNPDVGSGQPPAIYVQSEYESLNDNPAFFAWFLPVFA